MRWPLSAHALVLAALVRLGSGDEHELRRQDDTPVQWWCAQPEHRDSLVCKKLSFKNELRAISDPAERARVLAARREDSMVRPTPEQLTTMRMDERAMLEQFCARPEKEQHPFCAREALAAMRGHEFHNDVAAAREYRRAGREHGRERGERPVLEYDKAVEWYCHEGGHPDAARNAASSMICAAYRYRIAMQGATESGADAESKASIVEQYRKVKEAHKEMHDVKGHMAEQQRMLAEYCDMEAHHETKLCVKYLARTRKTELRRELRPSKGDE